MTFHIWKQVNCAYFLSTKGSFCFKKSSKANEGQQRPAWPKTSNFFVIITIQSKIINKCQYNTKKCVFKKLEIFIFITQTFWNYILLNSLSIPTDTNDIIVLVASFVSTYITWKKWKIIHKFPPIEILLNIWWKSLDRNSRYCQNHQKGVTSCFLKMVF